MEDAHSPRYTPIIALPPSSGSWRSATRDAAAAPSRRDHSGCRIRPTSAAARASTSSGGTRSPVSPGSTISGIPPTLVATLGSAQDMASRSAIGKFSARDGRTNTSRDPVVPPHQRHARGTWRRRHTRGRASAAPAAPNRHRRSPVGPAPPPGKGRGSTCRSPSTIRGWRPSRSWRAPRGVAVLVDGPERTTAPPRCGGSASLPRPSSASSHEKASRPSREWRARPRHVGTRTRATIAVDVRRPAGSNSRRPARRPGRCLRADRAPCARPAHLEPFPTCGRTGPPGDPASARRRRSPSGATSAPLRRDHACRPRVSREPGRRGPRTEPQAPGSRR